MTLRMPNIHYTINSYNLLLSRDSYVLWLLGTFIFILRKDLFHIEDLCGTVSKDPRIIFVTYFT